MSNLITAQELARRLEDPRLRVVDTRFDLSDVSSGEDAYRNSHIPGAVYAHLDRDLSGAKGPHGGRHPLPNPDELAQKLGRMGIGNDSSVVAYDDGNGMFASRLWWLLRYLGHEDVRVLDGGWQAWLGQGLPEESDVPDKERKEFTPRVKTEMAVDREHVLGRLGKAGVRLVDARAPERYLGKHEPLDPKAGHIPSALNRPFSRNLVGGRFRAADELSELYRDLQEVDEVIVYCGSGVSAAHDLLAMEEAGLEGAKLYHGSWSDWCSYRDSPVAQGEDE